MDYTPLGRTGLDVSRICLGTMTFGSQNNEAEAHALLDRVASAGVNFIDLAEMYPFPATEEGYGLTETIVGEWMARRGNRDKMVLATKINGPGAHFAYVRGGDHRHNRANIEKAVDDSLKRLKCDCIDLYQLHWPERKSNYLGRLGYQHLDDDDFTPLEETLDALGAMVEAGKVRAIGLSNETPWGLMKYLSLDGGGPRVASIQNPYSLLNRVFEIGLAEVAMREDCGLLAYSPLAFGALSGKYLGGARPAGCRYTLFPQYGRYFQPRSQAATDAYVALARRHGLDPCQMAIAYVCSRPFVTSVIIGVTSADQLECDLGSLDVTLSDQVLEGIEAIHASDPNPAP